MCKEADHWDSSMYISAEEVPGVPTSRLDLDSPQMSYNVISQRMGQ